MSIHSGPGLASCCNFFLVFLSVALHRNELVLVRETAWESRVLKTRSSVVFGRFHHGHSWQGCSRQEDLTRALFGQRCQRNLFCECAVPSGMVATRVCPLAFGQKAHQKEKNRGHDFPSQTRTSMRGSSCDVRVRQPRQRVGRRPPKEECPLAGGSTHCWSCTKQLQDKVPERHMQVTAQGPTSDHFVH